ncbi:uncharacterized protein BJ212DRAFT_1576453 [Suillus subaureus]|uniref:Uncharacterized protein n=1 Tax=Suillus subaureus TaxID=48587 RepID=A0A9P7ECI0_9AGAM|nr:uncharacterized protein BJ212DRAFT_1576453 [Suillus subaureus]KAG1817954.1 hypothetical protein BJ212DRAFT_1576453 [Suillus subaureus]
MPPQSGRPNRQFISQHDDGVVERDELSDGSEYNPKSCVNNHLAVKKSNKFSVGQNKIKLDRNKRALVRALVKCGKWDHKEIAATFHVSLPLIKRIVANSYITVTDKVSEDTNFYKQSDLEELILGLPPAPEKKSKRKTQDKTYAKTSNKSVQEVLCRQRVVASPSASISMEVEPDSNTMCSIFKMFQDEATLVHGEKVHSILEEIGIEDDETMPLFKR